MPTAIPAERDPGRFSRVACLLCLIATAGCGITSKAQNAEGVRLYQQGQFPRAQQRFHQAVYSNPQNADAYYNLAASYHQSGKLNQNKPDLEQAESYYHQCLDRNSDHRDCYRALAVLLVDQDRSDEAFRLIEGWSAKSPSLAEPKIELARLFQEYGDRETAERYLLEALAVDANNSRALAALGKIREEMGNHAQALANYQRSLYQDRFQPEVAARVAALQSALGTTPLATPSAAAPTTRTAADISPIIRQ